MDYSQLGKTPISESAPAGHDVSGEPLYEALGAEIKKLSSPTAAGGIDWPAMERLSGEILASRSKHLLAACCLCIARQHTAGWPGFAEGVVVLRDILVTYWQDCYPTIKRMRGRRNAFTWWQEMIEGLIAAGEPEQWQPGPRAELLNTLEEIDAFLGDNMEEAPVLRATIQAVSGHLTEAVPEPTRTVNAQETAPMPPDPRVAQPAPESSPPPPAARTSQPPMPAEELSPEKNLAYGCEFLRLTATQLRRSDPVHPLAFRLNRIAAWFPLEALPPADNGVTLLPPPDPQVFSLLKNLAARSDWPELLEAGEQQVRQHLFWLDPHYFVATALKRLGRDLARLGVEQETLLLLKRLPGLEKLAFSDGTPFAEAATRDWLVELQGGAQDGAAASATGDQAGQALAEKVARAQQLAEDNQLAQAVELLARGGAAARGGRERLRWDLAVCRLLCRGRQPQVAGPIAASLLAEVDRHHLDEWEPELAEEILTLVCQVLRLQEEDEVVRQQMRATLGRLAVLNPARALALI